MLERASRRRAGFVFALFAARLVIAQPAGSPVETPITMDQAVREAVENNLALLADKYNVAIADARILQARLRPNPVFSTGLDYQDLLGRGFTVENSAGPPEAQARVDYLVERGRKRELRTEVARAARTVAELQFLDGVRQLTFNVQSAFVDLQLARESLDLARQNLASLNAIVDVNRARESAGDLAKVELVRSQVAALQFENSVRQAVLRLQTAQNRLSLLLGRTGPAQNLTATGDLPRNAIVPDIEELRARALQSRPDLEALVRDQARSQSDIRLQLAQAKVDYTVGTMYHHQYSYSNGRAFGFFLSVPVPLFNRNQGEIERARLEDKQIEMRIRALRASIASEVESAFQQYTGTRALFENIGSNMLDRARQVRSTTEYSYRRGEASLIEFLDAQRTFNDTIDSYNQARAEYARSLYLLQSVTAKELMP